MKAHILSEKGTVSRQMDVEPIRWAEETFRASQEEFFHSLPKGTIISLGKGTCKVLAGEYKKSLKKIPQGSLTMSTNKGTSSYKLP